MRSAAPDSLSPLVGGALATAREGDVWLVVGVADAALVVASGDTEGFFGRSASALQLTARDWLGYVVAEDRPRLLAAIGALPVTHLHEGSYGFAFGDRVAPVVFRAYALSPSGRAAVHLTALPRAAPSRVVQRGDPQGVAPSAAPEGAALTSADVDRRIRNTLQLIASMLRVKLGSEANIAARRALDSVQSRVFALATVHDFLARHSGDELPAAPYVEELVAAIRGANRCSHVSVDVAVSLRSLHAEAAPRVGLVLHELLANALVHGCLVGKGRAVTVRVTRVRGQVSVEVRDDGPGIPEDLELDSLGTVGIPLVEHLLTQCHGRLTIRNAGGARVIARFGQVS